MRDGKHVADGAATELSPPVEGSAQRVRFAPPRSRGRTGGRLWFNSVYFVLLGIWAVAGSWHRHRVIGILAGLVYLELVLTFVRIASLSGAVVYDQQLAQRIAKPLLELCGKARCDVPIVVIRDDGMRAAAVRRGRRRRLVMVVSGPFFNRMDDRQIRAIIAHELIHVARNDFAAIRRRAWAALIAVCVVIGVVAGTTEGSVNIAVLAALGVVTAMVVNTALGTLNRRLERRADIEGAQLAEDPEGLASALEVAYAFRQEVRLRIFGPLPWRWVLSPLSWTPPTHPPMEQRIARLRAIASAPQASA